MKIQVWEIHGDGFHFGQRGLGQEESGDYLPSDSLAAAMLARLAERSGARRAQEWAEALGAPQPPFVLSSAFLFARPVRFFPAPALPPTAHAEGEERPKDLKKIRFVSEGVFRQLLERRPLAGLAGRDAPRLNGGKALLTAPEQAVLPLQATDRAWEVEKRPRVTVGRGAHNSSIYYTGRTVYAPGCGLWFGVRWLDGEAAFRKELAELLADLGDAGLGGERSSGFGQCRIVPAGDLDLPDPDGRPWVTLSRYWPAENETQALLDRAAAYTLVTVGGWAGSPGGPAQRRKAAVMLAEGSVLGPVEGIPGRLDDLQPVYENDTRPLGHPAWRCGRALGVGLKGARA